MNPAPLLAPARRHSATAATGQTPRVWPAHIRRESPVRTDFEKQTPRAALAPETPAAPFQYRQPGRPVAPRYSRMPTPTATTPPEFAKAPRRPDRWTTTP